MNSLIEQIIGDFLERPLPALTRRDGVLPGLPGKVDTLIGMRRTGKSWRLFQAMGDLVAGGLPKERLLYINFDDERLYPLTAAELHRIPDSYYRLFPRHKTQRCHFFFDEIQNVPGWERFVRRLLDTENVQLSLTGSSARLLSREIATTLRGRSLSSELFPFSFRETLRHQGIDERPEPVVGSRRTALLANRLRHYLEAGGFPEVQGIEAPYRLRILQEYVDVVILRDIVERHAVTNIPPLRYLIRHLLGAPATNFSVNKFHNDLKSQGIACGKNALHEYLAYLEDAYLLFPVPIYSRSIRKQQVNPRKIYPVDSGLALAFRHGPGKDSGRLLETLVFLELRRCGEEIAYYRTEAGYEVDFLSTGPEGDTQAIQVCETLGDPATRQREVRALMAAMRECGLSSGTIVTLDELETIATDSGPIEVIPAWRWLLREEGDEKNDRSHSGGR
ncbi:MAG: ATP-binding protein [Gammaproteobacteria bacterium]|nr:ATP-binding protein [Gammaproteobacteria bacterium]MBU1653468.1 ATP-binding protein [Gammaproteobacteria bacterium]MBU1962761.1 ATP-binding protein [Gammaproteobacteria bacterium]